MQTPKLVSSTQRSSLILYRNFSSSGEQNGLPKTRPHDCTQSAQYTRHGDAVDRPHREQTVFGSVSSVLRRVIGQEEHLRNDLFRVEWDVKPYNNKTRKPLKVAGVPQTPEMISAASGPKFTILWGHMKEILLLNKFFTDCRYMP